MKIFIDRKEGKFFVVEDSNGKIFSAPEEMFPDAEEGMVFEVLRDVEFEKGRAEKTNALFESLKKK